MSVVVMSSRIAVVCKCAHNELSNVLVTFLNNKNKQYFRCFDRGFAKPQC